MPRVRSPSDPRGLVLRIAAHVSFGAMPRYRATVSTVEKKVPQGAVLPDALTAFAAALRGIEAGRLGHFSIGPARVDGLVDLDDAALARIVPFASLSCGDVLALWWEGALSEEPRVVHLGAHGEKARVHASVGALISAIVAGTTGAPDLDDGTPTNERATLLRMERARAVRPPAALAKRFHVWAKAHAPSTPALDGVVAERIRKRLVAVVRREAARLPQPYRWTRGQLYRQWQLVLTPATGAVSWVAGGRVPFPAADEVRELLEALVRMTGQRGAEITIALDSEGRLYPDRRTVIAPPR